MFRASDQCLARETHRSGYLANTVPLSSHTFLCRWHNVHLATVFEQATSANDEFTRTLVMPHCACTQPGSAVLHRRRKGMALFGFVLTGLRCPQSCIRSGSQLSLFMPEYQTSASLWCAGERTHTLRSRVQPGNLHLLSWDSTEAYSVRTAILWQAIRCRALAQNIAAYAVRTFHFQVTCNVVMDYGPNYSTSLLHSCARPCRTRTSTSMGHSSTLCDTAGRQDRPGVRNAM